MINNRNYGLDTLRSLAIILVFMFHCFMYSKSPLLTSIGHVGWVGVDLFFVLSGYLIGNQIFSALKKQNFSLKMFYMRRFLRTLPNYFIVLALYFLIPSFRELPLTTPLWKFMTFTQNFGLSVSAFSHAWSLCIEEQFYFMLPIVLLLVIYKKALRLGWFLIGALLIGEMLLRGTLWLHYIQHAGDNTFKLYMTNLYYPSFSRLDGLILGVAIAMVRNFHEETWARITNKGNWWMLFGIIGCYFTFYSLDHLYSFMPTTFGFLFRAISFSALVIAALSPDSVLNRTKIPGAMTLATWSYAIYLIHKPLIHVTRLALSYWGIGESSVFSTALEIMVTLAGGWLLYTFIENPFLRLRDKMTESHRLPLELAQTR